MKNKIKFRFLAILLVTLTNIFCQNNSDTKILSQEEINTMRFMLEEEKVAFDVYTFLGEKWNLQVFANIKRSEAKHMGAMKGLLERNTISYQISSESGVFFNEELKIMYNNLIAKGSLSVIDALEVGKAIEEKDIEDLQVAISHSNDSYTKQVYTNLLNASYNHLNAFNRNLSR
ncbi:DUF2202 domain-containing protein [Flavobacterium jejuense]|uniref:DUF2202 domain-containing protein n=1 Tax=Flavobacterium jejuense TaxID=1544455 RepID=A0ABX0IWW3_9FLAO|nr:DUF2202 domain-containing protein [Flavobacterium jejuense]NHN26265.1 DUF2202 domain-containing protein [Flavobacterium jejuense]